MALIPGTRLGPYEILAPLGAGGMGEVYRARDVRLGREVAIKVLPSELSHDGERLARFEQEARSASALNHPNIVTVYDIGQLEEMPYIAMELVEGKTLRELSTSEPLPMRKLLNIASQIADGLAKAHAAGIVHRDLKPENVMVSSDGFVKIVDFGLAKLAPASSEFLSRAPTAGHPQTLPGAVLGTVAYMSPEQASGRDVDYRSDQFSFGSILYEMATGKKAFQKGSVVDSLSAIMHEDPPPITEANPQAPPPLRWIVERCLAKEPEERYASTKDLARDLAGLRDRLSESFGAMRADLSSPVAARRRRRDRLAWGLVAVFAAAAAALGLLAARPRSGQGELVRASLELPLDPAFGSQALSPDGRSAAYVAASASGQGILWIRPLATLEPRALAGTEGAAMPFWSPDGHALGFFSGGKLKTIDASGGPPRTLCDAPQGRGGAWNRDGVILFAPSYTGGLSRILTSGGPATPATRPDGAQHEFSHRWPHFLPDGRHFVALTLITDPSAGTETSVLALGSLGESGLRPLVADASNAAYAEPGYLLFAREGNLVAQRLDLSGGRLVGGAVPVASQPAAFHKRWGYAEFSISQTGLLLFRTSLRPRRRLTWLDRAGRPAGTVGVADYLRTARLSADGRSVAVVRFDPRNDEGDLWLYDTARGTATRFTFHPAYYGQPVWSPDGASVGFDSNLAGVEDLYRRDTSGSFGEEALLRTPMWKTFNDWSRDGRFVVFEMQDPKTGADIWAMPLSGERKPFLVLQTPFNEGDARFSPDGRWIAYYSNESGSEEIYARPFPGPGPKWQVSRAGGANPRWRRDGKELYFVSDDDKLMAVEIRTGPTFEAGVPRALFDLPSAGEGRRARQGRYDQSAARGDFDLSADGQRFLFAVPEGAPSTSVVLVLNWTAGLDR